ncbi:MAG: DUF1028 domain-containing protein [Vulcanimicrobiaceae bacterium]
MSNMVWPSTFSVVAADVRTGEVGVAVQSKFLSVGAIVPWVRAGVGAIATQAFANTAFGPHGLGNLESGLSPEDALAALLAGDSGRDDRQIGIVDVTGRAATFTGRSCIAWAGGIAGEGFAAQGNCLAGQAVVEALASAFTSARGHLADRFVAALRAGQQAGGDKRGQQSAALVIEKPGGGYAGFNDRFVDLRIDDHLAPIEELARILELHKLYYFDPLPHEVLAIDESLGRELVRELRRVGALATPNDAFDERARSALVAFMHVENLENRVRQDGCIDRQTLEYLRGVTRRVG